MKHFLCTLLLTLIPFMAFGAELSGNALIGKWKFTHMILDGETTHSVGRLMEFLPNGGVINYNKAGTEESRATYVVKPGIIIYTDKRGKQSWKVKRFEGDKLLVNHSGADMFFEK